MLRTVRPEMGLSLDADGQPAKENTVPDIHENNSLRIPIPDSIPRFETDEEYNTRTQSWTDSNNNLWAELVACVGGAFKFGEDQRR